KLKHVHRAKCVLADAAEQAAFDRIGVTAASSPDANGDDATTVGATPGFGSVGGPEKFDVVSVVLGKLSLTDPEFTAFLSRMHREVSTQDVKFGILGMFKGLMSGDAIARWLLHSYNDVLRTLDDAEQVGQSLVNQGYIRLVGPGSRFVAKKSSFYQ